MVEIISKINKEIPVADWSCNNELQSRVCSKFLDEVHGSTLAPEGKQKALAKFGIPAYSKNTDGSITTHELTAGGRLKEHTHDPADTNGIYSMDSYFHKDASQNHSIVKFGGDYSKVDSKGTVTTYADAQLSKPRSVTYADQTGYNIDSFAKPTERHFGPQRKDNFRVYTGGKDSGASSLDFSNIYAEVAPSTVQIQSPQNIYSEGTAVMVGKDERGCLAVTADHVVRKQNDNPDDKNVKHSIYGSTADGARVEIKVLDRNPQKDQALIALTGNDSACKPAAFAEQKPEQNDKTVHLGFPSETRDGKMTVVVGTVSENSSAGCPGKGAAAAGTNTFISTFSEDSRSAQPGMSGGPVVDKDGRLVGIMNSSSEDSSPVQFTCSTQINHADVNNWIQRTKAK